VLSGKTPTVPPCSAIGREFQQRPATVHEHVLKVVLKVQELVFLFEAVHAWHAVARLDLELEGIRFDASPYDESFSGAFEPPDLLIGHAACIGTSSGARR
jgi:hypothetical protein